MFLRKKITQFILLALLLKVSPVAAQIMPDQIKKYEEKYNEWGIIGGANLQSLTGYPFLNNYSTGGDLGVYFKKRKKSFGISAGLNVSTANYKTDYPAAHYVSGSSATLSDTTKQATLQVLYANLPVIVEYRPGKRLGLLIGLNFSYCVSTTDQNNTFENTVSANKIFKPLNVSFLAGLEYAFTPAFRIQAQLGAGYLDLNNKQFAKINDGWGTTNAQLNLIVRFKKWYGSRV